ncbi:ABC transporter permease [Microlunatus sp. Y2014]|uniref:ABC transporter permease n=1 Tax=Microlunatus sp. Y2014 TaxID=3418488 RepID=UPI003DA70F21
MLRRAWHQLRLHPTRMGAVVVAIMISVSFVTTCLVFLDTEAGAIRNQVAAPASNADVIAEPNPAINPAELPTDEIHDDLAGVPGVELVAPLHQSSVGIGDSGALVYGTVPESLRWAELVEGRWAETASEIVLDSSVAESHGLNVGAAMTVTRYGDEPQPEQLTVVGITDAGGSLLSGLAPTVYVSDAWFDTPAEAGSVNLWLIQLVPGTDVDGAVAGMQEAMSATGAHVEVQSATAYADAQLAQMTSGVDVFRVLLLIFGAIALLVGMLIIANTFSIIVAQRRRQIGLLRAVGASTGQVRGELLIEALVIGVVASALGVAAGIGLGAAAAALSGSLDAGLVVSTSVLIAWAVGVVITVAAAWLPSLRTSRIRPLEALRVSATDEGRRRPGGLITIVSALCLFGGIGVVGLGVVLDRMHLVTAVGGGFLLALAVLTAAGWYVPAIVRLVGRIPALTGPTARLAAANAVRHPKRTTATCLALMLAVGLVATLQIGSASVKASVEQGVTNRYPVPIQVVSWDGSLPSGLADEVAGVEGVTGVVEVATAELTLAGLPYPVRGLGPEVGALLPGEVIGPDELLVNPSYALAQEWAEGEQVEVGGPGGTRDLAVRLSHLAEDGPVVSAATLRELGGDVVERAEVWAQVDTRDSDAAAATLAGVEEIAPDNTRVSGSLTMVTLLTELLDMLLLIATALLGAAVLIALIGVGNTLGLSVLERTRESALLRALGLQRTQLRAMLAVESVLLAVAGALIGLLAGLGFGYLGTWAVMAEIGEPAVLAVSWPQLGFDVGAAVVAGLLASILPARRAVTAAPTEALADV